MRVKVYFPEGLRDGLYEEFEAVEYVDIANSGALSVTLSMSPPRRVAYAHGEWAWYETWPDEEKPQVDSVSCETGSCDDDCGCHD